MGIDGLLLKAMKTGQAGKAGMSKRIDPKMTMNGSIFDGTANMVSGTTQTQATNRTAFSGTINNVANANVAKSVSGLSSAKPAHSAQRTRGQEDNKDIDISNYDFDNLTQVSESELQGLKSELTELKDSNAPLFLLNGIKTKLGKVNNEISKRAEASGNKVDEKQDNKELKNNNEPSATDGKLSAKDAKSIADGIKMINKALVKMLEDKYGLTGYGKEGDEFNPDEHEAIGRMEDEKAKKETLAQ